MLWVDRWIDEHIPIMLWGGGLKEEFVLRAVRHIISIFDLYLWLQVIFVI